MQGLLINVPILTFQLIWADQRTLPSKHVHKSLQVMDNGHGQSFQSSSVKFKKGRSERTFF